MDRSNGQNGRIKKSVYTPRGGNNPPTSKKKPDFVPPKHKRVTR